MLVDGDLVICTPGGKDAAFAALNKMTGEVVWKCALEKSDNAEYSSIMPIAVGDGKQYVGFLRSGLVGVDAKTGKLLWKYEKIIDMASNIMTPVVYQDKVFASSSRGGGALLEIKASGEPKEVYSREGARHVDRRRGPHRRAPLRHDRAACTASNSPPASRSGWKPPSAARASASRTGGSTSAGTRPARSCSWNRTRRSTSRRAESSRTNRSTFAAWPHPIVANGGLYVRDQDTLVCWDVKK